MGAKLQPAYVEPDSDFCTGGTWGIKDLSDHYPVIVRFAFKS